MMKNYFEFRAVYIATLMQLLECKAPTYKFRIDSPNSNALADKLADMEEENPIWVEKIEDYLSNNHLLQ